MNKQGNKTNPSGGIEWTHIFGPGTGFTANPVRGCQHQCRWKMPDGNVAICYAESQRDRLNGKGAFQKITFHPEVLAAIRKHKQRAGIFIDSMSDLFAQGVENEWLAETLHTIRECPQHIFFSLTKNPARFVQLRREYIYPLNLFLGVSMPPTFMFGKELTVQQQTTWFHKALEKLCACDAAVRWVSLEPLSWDCSDILAQFRDRLHWAVIGAASDGARTHQPAPHTLARVLDSLAGLPVFFKGNLRDSITPSNGFSLWRQEFPNLTAENAENAK
jgi:protein gp37